MKPTPSDPRSPKAVWDQQHEFALNDPLMWQLKADSLAAAFDVLIEDDIRRKLDSARARRIPSVEYMLAGFALENLLKGQLIARHKHRDETGAFKLKTHDLRQLARDAGYEMSEPENRLLEKIQEFATWTARYPVPLDSEAMRPRPTPDGGFAPRTYGQLGADWPAIRALLARFKSDLLQIRSVRAGA